MYEQLHVQLTYNTFLSVFVEVRLEVALADVKIAELHFLAVNIEYM